MDELVEQLRRKYVAYNDIPKLMISVILQDTNIKVEQWPVNQDFSGMLWKYSDQWTIVVNSNHAKTKQVFTVCHELCHYFAHRQVKKKFACFNVGAYTSNRLELEANRFATELLMPRKAVLEMLPKYSTLEMAKTFCVSEQMVNYRVKELGLK